MVPILPSQVLQRLPVPSRLNPTSLEWSARPFVIWPIPTPPLSAPSIPPPRTTHGATLDSQTLSHQAHMLSSFIKASIFSMPARSSKFTLVPTQLSVLCSGTVGKGVPWAAGTILYLFVSFARAHPPQAWGIAGAWETPGKWRVSTKSATNLSPFLLPKPWVFKSVSAHSKSKHITEICLNSKVSSTKTQ